MADLQPPKQAPQDPGAHELDGTHFSCDVKLNMQARHTDTLQNPQTITSPQHPRATPRAH